MGGLSLRTDEWGRATLDGDDVGCAVPCFGACSAARASAANARCRANSRSCSRKRVRSSSTLVPFLCCLGGQNAALEAFMTHERKLTFERPCRAFQSTWLRSL